MKKTIIGLLCAFTLLAGTACGQSGGGNTSEGIPMNDTFFNPLRVERGMGDPWMYFHDGYYYYMHSEGTQITLTKSPWMTQIYAKPGDDSVTKIIARQKAMNLVEIWAPEIFFFEGHWYVYFTATKDSATEMEKDAGRRTYALKSKTEDAMGEWEQAVEVKLPMDYRSIDATFMDYGGRQYIVWSGWPNAATDGFLQNLYITELETGNPLKAKSLDPARRVRISTPLYDWETNGAPQNEGPVVIQAPDGTPVVLYSASYSGADYYCIGYLKLNGSDPMDGESWAKGKQPLMETDVWGAEIIAPGHCSVVKSPNGAEDWICYHSAKKSGSGWDRMTRLQKLTWNGSTPVVEKLSGVSEEVELPGGERVNRYRYEAEDAKLSEGCVTVSLPCEDDDGNFLYDYPSGGKAVQLSGGQGADRVAFEVNVPENGEYLLSVRFSNTSVAATEIEVTVNGTVTKLYAPLTDHSGAFTQNGFYTGLYLRQEGANVIEISCDKNIVIDCIVVDYLGRN